MLQNQSFNKVVLVLLGLFFVLFMGCSTRTNVTEGQVEGTKTEDNLPYYQSIFKKLDSLLPVSLNRDEYWMIYRFGPIEFTSEYSVLCIPKSQINSDEIEVSYFLLRSDEGHIIQAASQKQTKPSAVQFNLHLLNNGGTTPAFNRLLKIKHSELFDYISKELELRPGEGICSNHYIVFSPNKEDVYAINFKAHTQTKKFLQRLYEQISLSEHLQSLSLDLNCEENKLFADSLIRNKSLLDNTYQVSISQYESFW